MAKCRIEGCDNNESKSIPGLHICLPCYRYIHRWMKRGVADTIYRQDQIAKWQARLDSAMSGAKVTRIKRKKKTGR